MKIAFKSYILILGLLNVGVVGTAFGAAYQYEVQKPDNHLIHLVKIDASRYDAQIVKAEPSRETVSTLAERHKAEIAINGGFFNIGLNDGIPTGSLVVDGKVYALKNLVQALAITCNGHLKIKMSNPKEYLKTPGKSQASLVSGIPMLINEGKIVESSVKRKSSFYKKPHARTALGLLPNGQIIICVVEHRYLKDFSAMTLKEMQSFFQEKASRLSERYNKKQGDLTVNEIKSVLKEEVGGCNKGIRGFTIPELALYLKKIGCEFAINLDGGGSSTLWINGKVVNATIGDEDEGKGLHIARPVSDVIIFSKKA